MTQNFETTDSYVKRNEVQDEGVAVDITNKASGGAVGTSATTVDVAGVLRVNQTTAGQALTLPTPTSTTVDHRITVINVGSASFTMYGRTLGANGSSDFMWNSTYGTPAWVAFGSISTTLSTGAITSSGSILSTSATGGIGYSGVQEPLTQLTSKSTTVTSVTNSLAALVSSHNASLAGAAIVSFTFSNTSIAATDFVGVSVKSGAATGKYTAAVTATGAGSCQITITNIGATAGEVVVLNITVFKTS